MNKQAVSNFSDSTPYFLNFVKRSPKIRMNDNVVDFVGLAVQRLLFPVLRVIFPKVHLDQKQNKFCKKINLRSHRDLAELGSVDAVGGGGDVPVVEENPPALVR